MNLRRPTLNNNVPTYLYRWQDDLLNRDGDLGVEFLLYRFI